MKREAADRDGGPHAPVKGEESGGTGSGKGRLAGHLLFVAVILITGVIVYSNSFDCSFHSDDSNVIGLSRGSDRLGDWIEIFPSRPVGVATFFLNHHFHKLDVWGYHLVNLAIHLANAMLVWWLILLTFSSPVMREEKISRHRTVIAFLAALLFVSHPLATQSVTYIVQRFASLATMFYLLSLALYVKGRLRQGGGAATYVLYGASIISAVLGMLSKEIVFTLPFAIVLYEIFFLKTSAWKAEAVKNAVPVFLIILGLFAVIFFRNNSLQIFNPVPPGQGYHYSISAKEYLFTQFSVIVTYIRLFFLPINLNLDYDYPISHTLFEARTLLSFALLSGIVAAGLLLFRRYRLVSFGIFWFFLTLSVESSILPISQNVIFEHRTYLPGFGFFLVLAATPFYLAGERHLKIAVAALLIIAAINSVLTFQRNYVWKSEYTLWTDVLKKSPNKARALNFTGKALYKMKQYREAISYYDRAIALSPGYVDAYYGRAMAKEGLQDFAGAIADYNMTIQLAKKDTDSFFELDACLSQLGTIYGITGRTDDAIRLFREALAYNPNLEKVHYNLGVLLLGRKEDDEALTHFRHSMRINPRRERVRMIAGNILVRQNRVSEAIPLFEEEVMIRPGSAEAYTDLGSAYYMEGRPEKAVACYQKALQLDAKNRLASENLNAARKKTGKSGVPGSCP